MRPTISSRRSRQGRQRRHLRLQRGCRLGPKDTSGSTMSARSQRHRSFRHLCGRNPTRGRSCRRRRVGKGTSHGYSHHGFDAVAACSTISRSAIRHARSTVTMSPKPLGALCPARSARVCWLAASASSISPNWTAPLVIANGGGGKGAFYLFKKKATVDDAGPRPCRWASITNGPIQPRPQDLLLGGATARATSTSSMPPAKSRR